MVFVQQSAGRYVGDKTVEIYLTLSRLCSILRAMFEICLKRGWSIPTRAALDLCKMVDKRL